jgi:hypothetical protein
MEMRGSEDSFMFQRKEKTNVEDCEKYCRRRNVRARRQHHLGAEKHLTKKFEKMKTRPYQNQHRNWAAPSAAALAMQLTKQLNYRELCSTCIPRSPSKKVREFLCVCLCVFTFQCVCGILGM